MNVFIFVDLCQKFMNEITIPKACDMHIHLRQGDMMKFVTKKIKEGGSGLVYVMPNLIPPITTTDQAMEYKKKLEELDHDIEFIMTLCLCPQLTIDEIKKAHSMGIRGSVIFIFDITGVKSYPRGVTTNSENGIESYELYYHIFLEMESLGMVLNLHGEIPSNPSQNICILNAEELFLVELVKLNTNFPNLKIVLEHATTKKAIDTVINLNSNVACTITLHHLWIIIDDWAGNVHNYCKPVAKYPEDREALRDVVKSGNKKFFLGSDSAPHLLSTKLSSNPPAGIFTSSILIPCLATIFDRLDCLGRLGDFICFNSAKFYDLDAERLKLNTFTLVKDSSIIPDYYDLVVDGKHEKLLPFRAGLPIDWKIKQL